MNNIPSVLAMFYVRVWHYVIHTTVLFCNLAALLFLIHCNFANVFCYVQVIVFWLLPIHILVRPSYLDDRWMISAGFTSLNIG
jgi:hypothetical protein